MQLRDFVRDCLGWPRRGSVSQQMQATPAKVETIDAAVERRKRNAAALFAEAVSPIGTIVETFLASRNGLRLPEDVASSVVRYHPACPWRDSDIGPTIRVPAMVAAMRNIRTNELTGVHRTRLTPDGQKVGRKMLGIAAGAAIKLDADEEVTQGLVIGEGIETCLAARQLGYRPVWALGSVGGIERFPVLSGLDCLSILAEDDATGANAKAITALADRWHEAGREVLAIASRVGGDINDALERAV